MLLRKTLLLSDCDLKMAGDSGRFEGYAAVFSNRDLQGDVILPGAFKKTLAQNGLPKMFYDHNWGMPIGRYEDASERTKGLWVVGELTPGHSLASDVHAAMKHNTIDGLSVGGSMRKGDYRVENDTRFIDQWSMLIEVSPTVFPANPKSRIDPSSVKSADLAELTESIEEIESIRDLERFLRDAGSFSKGAASALVARVKVVLGVEGEPAAQTAETKAMAALHQRLMAMGNSLGA